MNSYLSACVCVWGGGITGQSILQLLEIKARLTLNPELVLVCLCLPFFPFQSSMTNLNGFYCTIIVCTPPHFLKSFIYTVFPHYSCIIQRIFTSI